MNQTPHPGTLITVFGLYPGNVIKGPAPAGQVLVEYRMPTCKVRGTVAIADILERGVRLEKPVSSRQENLL